MQDEDMIKEIIENNKEENNKTVNFVKNEFFGIRAGRANPHILDKISVDYYGTLTPINQMANISVPEARMLLINVWDQNKLRDISKAISIADIGVNPIDDGKVIRLIFPALTEEKRREIVRQIKKIAEDGKVSIRNNRRDSLDMLKQMKKDSSISEDEYISLEKDVQKITDNFSDILDELTAVKEKEVLEI